MAPPIGASSRPSAPSPPTFASDPDYLGPISATPQKMVEEMLCMANVVRRAESEAGHPGVVFKGHRHAHAGHDC
jgi:hypothetical protein